MPRSFKCTACGQVQYYQGMPCHTCGASPPDEMLEPEKPALTRSDDSYYSSDYMTNVVVASTEAFMMDSASTAMPMTWKVGY